jgi:hypothetical protein
MGFNGILLRAFWCPQCDKQKLVKPIDHVVSKEKISYQTRSGDKIELFGDICDSCRLKNFNKYFKPLDSDPNSVLNAMKNNKSVGSLEDIL